MIEWVLFQITWTKSFNNNKKEEVSYSLTDRLLIFIKNIKFVADLSTYRKMIIPCASFLILKHVYNTNRMRSVLFVWVSDVVLHCLQSFSTFFGLSEVLSKFFVFLNLYLNQFKKSFLFFLLTWHLKKWVIDSSWFWVEDDRMKVVN